MESEFRARKGRSVAYGPLQRIHERAEAFIRELERVAGARIRIPREPQILGAYGAALLAAEDDGSRGR